VGRYDYRQPPIFRRGYPLRVEYIFVALVALAGVATLWFTCYVLYRLFSDQR